MGKLMRKLVAMFSIVAAMASLTLPAWAADDLVPMEEDIYPGIEGEFLTFPSVDDETGSVLEGLPNFLRVASGTIIWREESKRGGSTHVEQAVATREGYRTREFIRYLTGSWAKASSYAWTQTNTVSWSYDTSVEFAINEKVRASLGYSQSRSVSYGATTTIEADPKRESKLGFASDFVYQYFNYEVYNANVLSSSKASWIKTPGSETYLVIYYK